MEGNTGEFRRQIKVNAKRRLMEYFWPCVGVALLGTVISTLFSEILAMKAPDLTTMLSSEDLMQYMPQALRSDGLSIAFTFLISPLTFGSYAFFAKTARGEKPPFSLVFSWIGEGAKLKKSYGAAAWYLLIRLKYVALWCLAPAAVVVATAYFPDALPGAAGIAVYIAAMTLLVIGAVMAYAAQNAYLPALFRIAAHPELPVRRTFSEVGTAMKTRVWEFFRFQLSFLGWEILTAFTGGVLQLFVSPYLNLSIARFEQLVFADGEPEDGKDAQA